MRNYQSIDKDDIGIKRLRISGFKSIRELDLELSALNIVVGANGAGKSNLIGVFEFLCQVLQGKLECYVKRSGGAERFLYLGSKQTSCMRIGVGVGDTWYNCVLEPAIPDGLMLVDDETCSPPNSVSVLAMLKRDYAIDIDNLLSELFLREHWGMQVYHFHDTGDSATIRKPSGVNDNVFLRGDGANLASIISRLKKHHIWEFNKIIAVIKMVAPFFDEFVLEPDEAGMVMLKWKQHGCETVFDSYYFSDGTLRFIALVTLLLSPVGLRPKCILLDEPELGLHPFAIHLLTELMRSFVSDGKHQIIATTQSVTFVNMFQPEDIVVASVAENGSHFSRLERDDVKAWLEDFAMGEIWERNIIGGTPNE